jgi:porphobilinogen deaminase
VFGHARKVENSIVLKAGIVSLDGVTMITVESSTNETETAIELGNRVAIEVLEKGGKEILEQIKLSQ